MDILFSKSNWDAGPVGIPAYLARTKADGFDAAEVFLPNLAEPAARDLGRQARDAGLGFIAHIGTSGNGIREHLDSLERWFAIAVETRPELINCHGGKDHFAFDDNLRLLARSTELARAAGVPFAHETHRGRALFACNVTRRFLDALPDLRLTADFSHWTCVHESDLRDQQADVDAAVARSIHLHARVGFGEGPQVGDPAAEHFRPWLERFAELWTAVVRAAAARGQPRLFVTPEFGPVPYVPVTPADGKPVVDVWAVNCWMRDWFRRTIRA